MHIGQWIFSILAISDWLFWRKAFFVFLHYKINRSKGVFWPKIPLNLTSEGLKYPPEVRVQHETCSTICGTHVQAILDQKNLTGLAGGVREGQNFAPNGPRFWLLSPLEAPKCVQDPGNGLKSIRGSWGDHLGSISGVLPGQYLDLP